MPRAARSSLITSMGGVLVIGVAFGLPGLVICIVAAVLLRGARAERGVSVDGEVVDHEHYISHGVDMYIPLYRATTLEGTVVTGRGRTGSSRKEPPVGKQLRLVYVADDPDRPLQERGVSSTALISTGIMFLIGGALIALWVAAVVNEYFP